MDEEDGKGRGHGEGSRGSQFKKGQSGNPKGRTRGSKSIPAYLSNALNEPVAVNENGRRRKIPKIEAIFKQLSNKAASGDTRSAKLLMDMSSKFKSLRSDAPPPKSAELPDEFNFWVQVLLILRECDALREAPVGLREAIDSADWELVKKIAQFKSSLFEHPESNEEE
jgi:Family of unknown function (DUF5681)